MHFADGLGTGMRAAVTCVISSGDPPFKFSWHKDGSSLLGNNRVSFTNHEFMSALVISDLGPDDNGNYTCSVSNDAGRDEKFDVLNMKGK